MNGLSIQARHDIGVEKGDYIVVKYPLASKENTLIDPRVQYCPLVQNDDQTV